MPHLYLCGHGSKMNGTFPVPDNTWVYFYVDAIGKELDEETMSRVLAGPPTSPLPKLTYGPRSECPKVMLYPIMGLAAQRYLRESIQHFCHVQTLVVAQPTPLENILKRYAYANVHWVACTS